MTSLEELSSTAKKYRFRAPSHETKHPWFSHLLDAYAFLDAAIEADILASGRQPACHGGCDACCSQPIPALPAEILGIKFFLQQLLQPEQTGPSAWAAWAACAERAERAGCAAQTHAIRPCRFLVNSRCVIYPVRPMACRRYIIFSQPCGRDESPIDTRPSDVLNPATVYFIHALQLTLPIYQGLGFPESHTTPAPLRFFLEKTVLLKDVPWE